MAIQANQGGAQVGQAPNWLTPKRAAQIWTQHPPENNKADCGESSIYYTLCLRWLTDHCHYGWGMDQLRTLTSGHHIEGRTVSDSDTFVKSDVPQNQLFWGIVSYVLSLCPFLFHLPSLSSLFPMHIHFAPLSSPFYPPSQRCQFCIQCNLLFAL